jgi:hypothetical protein
MQSLKVSKRLFSEKVIDQRGRPEVKEHDPETQRKVQCRISKFAKVEALIGMDNEVTYRES